MNMRLIFLMTLTIVLLAINLYSQPDGKTRKQDYLSFQTGFIDDNYFSLGIKTCFEYQKEMKGNWLFGITYENSRHFADYPWADNYGDDIPSNLSLLSYNIYYKLNLIKDGLFWTAGLGIGGVHAYWDENDYFGATLNASLTLNIRLSKRIYFESSPLIVLIPTNRLYYSTMNVRSYNDFFAITLFPFGLKVKL